MKPQFLIYVLLAFLSINVFAKEGGNGGDVIKADGKYYVLDLYEAGVHKKPFFIEDDVDLNLLEIAKTSFPGFSNEFQSKFTLKLQEIKNVYPGMYYYVRAVVDQLTFSVVPADLVEIDDHQDTVIILDNHEVKQLAIRQDNSVKISESVFKSIDIGNQVALIFHEIFYSTVMPEAYCFKDSKLIPCKTPKSSDDMPYDRLEFHQQSKSARIFNGYLFSELFSLRGSKGVDAVVKATNLFWVRKNIYERIGASFPAKLEYSSSNFSLLKNYKNGKLIYDEKTSITLSFSTYYNTKYRKKYLGCEDFKCRYKEVAKIELKSEKDLKNACKLITKPRSKDGLYQNYKDHGYLINFEKTSETKVITSVFKNFFRPFREGYELNNSILFFSKSYGDNIERLYSESKRIKLKRWYRENELDKCTVQLQKHVATITNKENAL